MAGGCSDSPDVNVMHRIDALERAMPENVSVREFLEREINHLKELLEQRLDAQDKDVLLASREMDKRLTDHNHVLDLMTKKEETKGLREKLEGQESRVVSLETTRAVIDGKASQESVSDARREADKAKLLAIVGIAASVIQVILRVMGK